MIFSTVLKYSKKFRFSIGLYIIILLFTTNTYFREVFLKDKYWFVPKFAFFRSPY